MPRIAARTRFLIATTFSIYFQVWNVGILHLAFYVLPSLCQFSVALRKTPNVDLLKWALFGYDAHNGSWTPKPFGIYRKTMPTIEQTMYFDWSALRTQCDSDRYWANMRTMHESQWTFSGNVIFLLCPSISRNCPTSEPVYYCLQLTASESTDSGAAEHLSALC